MKYSIAIAILFLLLSACIDDDVPTVPVDVQNVLQQLSDNYDLLPEMLVSISLIS